MTTVGGFIQQIGRTILKDGGPGQLAQNRDESLITNDITSLVNTWLRGGKLWEAHFATEGGTATVESNAAIDLTEPFFRMAVKSGKVIVPISVYVAPATVWETGDEWIVGAYDTDAAATGGALPDIRNMVVNNGSQPAIGDNDNGVNNPLDGDSAITEGAVTNFRVIKNGHELTGGLHLPVEYSILKGDAMGMLEGPSVFGVWLASTSGIEVLYSVKWAVLDSAELRAA